MKNSAFLALALQVLLAPQLGAAVQEGDAKAMLDAFNAAFLVRDGSGVYYKKSLNDGVPDPTFAGCLDIMAVEDAFERTGDDETKALVNDLLTTWLNNNDPNYWRDNQWNDDYGWFSIALARGYQITGNQVFLDQARFAFDSAWARGWDTQYNDGGIWEEQPEGAANEDPPVDPWKQALSNNSLGKGACLIYQINGDQWYLDRCQQIFNWVEEKIYNAETGQINAGVYMDGTVNTDGAAYSQGTWIDYVNLLHTITGDSKYFDIAKKSVQYGRDSLTVNGVFSRNNPNDNTWADDFARGLGHFVKDNGLWDDYYEWMVQNADAILANREANLGITWNGWDTPTQIDDKPIANRFVSAVAWLQYTPATKPSKLKARSWEA